MKTNGPECIPRMFELYGNFVTAKVVKQLKISIDTDSRVGQSLSKADQVFHNSDRKDADE